MDFFERVKMLVKAKTSLTLMSFITELGIDYEKYRSSIRYNNLPRADEALKIAQALNVSVEYLVLGKEENIYKTKYDTLVKNLTNLVSDL